MLTSAGGTIQDNIKKSYVISPSRGGVETAQEVSLASSISPFGEYDSIIATYPTTASELYTYSLSAVDIGTIEVTYTNSSKTTLTSVVKVEL